MNDSTTFAKDDHQFWWRWFDSDECGSTLAHFNLDLLNVTSLLVSSSETSSSAKLRQCAQSLAATWLPAVCLLFLAPLHLFSLQSVKLLKNSEIPLNWYNGVRLATVAFLVALNAVQLNFVGVLPRLWHLTPPAVNVFVYALFGYILNVHRRCGLHTSAFAFFFSLCLLFANVPQFGSVVFEEAAFSASSSKHLLFSLEFGAICLLFVLTCFADEYQPPRNSKKSPLKECPEAAASFLSQLTFWWANSLFTYGYSNTINKHDLWELPEEKTAEVVSRQLEVNWRREFAEGAKWKRMAEESEETEEKSANKQENWREDIGLLFAVWKVLIRTFGRLYLAQTAFSLCSTLISFAHPQLLKLFFAFISSASASTNQTSTAELPISQQSNSPLLLHGYLIAGLFFFTSGLGTFISEASSRASSTASASTSTAFTAMLYRKSLCLDASTRSKTSSGDLVTLLNSDAGEMTSVLSSLNQLWMTPLEIAIALYFLWFEVGGAGDLVALAIILLMIPLNVCIKGRQKASRKRHRTKRKERIKLTTELIAGIRLLKYYAWEVPFSGKIHQVRKEELAEISIFNGFDQLLDFIWSVAPFAVSLATFSVYLLLGAEQRSLTAGKVFVSLSLFNLLRSPLRNLPRLWSNLAKVAVSVKKVTAFLNSEMEFYVKNDEDRVNHVKLNSTTLAWEKKKEPTLKEISLKVRRGSLVAVVGSVGAGKSSLLSAILGDMELLSGNVTISTETPSDSIGYVAQQAWIQNATIRDNILFGEEFQEERYQGIIEDCALVEDLRQLPAGDLTEIGEKGVNLSGGQKHRLALARACYSSTAALYLLDDPLAAVDSHVANHIFKRVISNQDGLLKDKTRILVTSSVAVLPEVDQIVLMEGGQITQMGTYEELLTKSSFAEFVKEKSNNSITSNASLEKVSLKQSKAKNQSNSSNTKEEAKKSEVDKPSNQAASSDGQLIEAEKDKSTRVPLAVYNSYFLSLTYKAILLCCILLGAGHLSSTGSRVWLALWSSENGNIQQQKKSEESGLGFYGFLGLLSAAFYGLGSVSLVRSGLTSASTIHTKLLNHLTRLPAGHFDRTPIGRTINLVSGNLHSVDFSLPSMIRGIFMCTVSVLTNLALLSTQMPVFLAVFLPVFAFYCAFESFHRVTDRQLQRLSYASYSPVYSHFYATHAGMATIRALGAQRRFQAQCNQRLDANRRAAFACYVARAWMTLRKDLLTDLLSLAIQLMIVGGSLKSSEGSSIASQPGFVGLLLSQSSSLTTAHYLVAMFGWLDASMASVERIEECCARQTEDEWEKEVEGDQGQEWPSRGEVEFVDYSVRYREGLELVLKEVNLEIQAGEKVGIVGRTGAGKSTMTLALFRILEPSAGKILIDGVDIASVGLHRLRRGLAIIPQDPTLFSGTIRSSLDPFGVYSDERLIEALTQCHLKKVIDSTDLGLNSVVAENGTNFSVGEKQLLCAARALLVGAKILVLDEATSAVDPKTDFLIGETIRTAFAHCTVLTIAHRINSILEADRIMVVEAGRIVEFAPPSVLLASPKSAFYSLAKDAGLV